MASPRIAPFSERKPSLFTSINKALRSQYFPPFSLLFIYNSIQSSLHPINVEVRFDLFNYLYIAFIKHSSPCPHLQFYLVSFAIYPAKETHLVLFNTRRHYTPS